MKKYQWMVIILFISLLLLGAIIFYQFHKPKKPIIQDISKENWILILPEKEFCNNDKEQHLLLAKVDKGISVVFDKNSKNGKEKTEFSFTGQFPSKVEPLINLSPDLRKFAFVNQIGLTIRDRKTQREELLEKNIIKTQDNKYSYSYINKILWSYDANYLLFENIGFEWNQIGILEVKNKLKFFPKGDGVLSGSNIRWSATENTFLDASYQTAYGHFPGLYLSEPNNPKKFKNLAPLLNLKSYVFYDAIFSPDSTQIAFHGYQNEVGVKELHVYNHINKSLLLICTVGNEDLIDRMFYSPSGTHLYYCVRGPTKTTLYSYHFKDQTKNIIFTIESGPKEVVDSRWINENQLVLEIISTERFSFVNSQIVIVDLQKQALLFATNPSGSLIKILSVN